MQLKPPEGTEHLVVQALDSTFANISGATLEIDGGLLPHLEGHLVRWLLLEVVPTLSGSISRVIFNNVTITGLIDLAATTISVIPRFHHCYFVTGRAKGDSGIDLTDSSAIGFEILGGKLEVFRADRLALSGSLVLRAASIETGNLPTTNDVLQIAHGVLLCGAHIHGNVDLRGTIIHPLASNEEDTEQRIALLADGLSVEGHFLFSARARASGEVRLNGCRIQRNLDCSNALLKNPGGFSLSAAGAEILGSVYFNTNQSQAKAASIGEIRLDGAHIHGNLDLSGANLTATNFAQIEVGASEDGAVALSASGLTVDADLDLSDKFVAKGSILLISAKIGSDLRAKGSKFDFPGEAAFCADGASIDGVLDFRGSSSTGLIRLVQAKFGQGAYFDSFRFDLSGKYQGVTNLNADVFHDYGADVCGLYAGGASAGGNFSWTNILLNSAPAGLPRRVVLLVAPGASVAELNDDETSWAAVDRLDLRGCSYSRVSDLSTDISWRIDRLDREYAPWNQRGWTVSRLTREVLWRTLLNEHRATDPESLGAQIRRFSPDPYLQLARVLHDAGLEQSSQQVLLRLERNRTRYSGLSVPGILWRGALDTAIAFGAAPFRPIYALVLPWTIVSAVLFKWIHDLKQMGSPHDGTAFSGLFYALDSLIPFVDFGQRKGFPIERLDSWAGLLLLFNTLLGYAAASFLAAGLSGLAKLGKDGD